MLPGGTRIGRYEIRSKIGAGGMGEVYLAQDMKLDWRGGSSAVTLLVVPATTAVTNNKIIKWPRTVLFIVTSPSQVLYLIRDHLGGIHHHDTQ